MPRNVPAWSAALLLTSTLVFGVLFANAVPQSLPETVTHARTVFVENETGFNELQYTLIMELSKWGRFDLADSPEKADLILRLDNGNHVRMVPSGEFPSTTPANTSADSEIPKGHTRISLLDPKRNSILWADMHKTEGGKVKNGHLLDGLREAFDMYEKSRR
jgi:hypothetical protein